MRSETKTTLLFSVLISSVIITIFSYSTSVLYQYPTIWDSGIFQVIGKNWAEGHLPYVCTWDSKGPFIFLVNALAYALTGSKLGLYVFELINFSTVMFVVIKTFRLEFTKNISYIFAFLWALAYASLNREGNRVEEWILPYLVLSYYYLIQWCDNYIKSKDVRHKSVHSFVYGVFFALSLMSRLTNAFGVCVGILVIVFCLIADKQWKNLALNGLLFLVGCAVVLVPFNLYFYNKDALYEMWYGTFIYNLEYADKSVWIGGLKNFIINYWNVWTAVVVALLVVICSKSRRKIGAFWLLNAVAVLLMFQRSNGFAYYAQLSLPFICVSLIELHRLVRESNDYKKFYILFIAFVVCFTVPREIYFSYRYLYADDNKNTYGKYWEVLNELPNDYKTSFVGYNIPPAIYLYGDITPASRFFTLQDFETSLSPSLTDKLRAEYSAKNIKWLLVDNKADRISDIIAKRYTLYKDYPDYNLKIFKLKDGQ